MKNTQTPTATDMEPIKRTRSWENNASRTSAASQPVIPPIKRMMPVWSVLAEKPFWIIRAVVAPIPALMFPSQKAIPTVSTMARLDFMAN
jgi:hypothetical protein